MGLASPVQEPASSLKLFFVCSKLTTYLTFSLRIAANQYMYVCKFFFLK